MFQIVGIISNDDKSVKEYYTRNELKSYRRIRRNGRISIISVSIIHHYSSFNNIDYQYPSRDYHVTAMSHVTEVIYAMAMAMAMANALTLALALTTSQVIWISIYSPFISRSKYRLFLPKKGITSHKFCEYKISNNNQFLKY